MGGAIFWGEGPLKPQPFTVPYLAQKLKKRRENEACEVARGRPRKTLEQLRLIGNFRPGLHAGRINEPQVSGEPVKPKGLDRDASKLWGEIVPQLTAAGITKQVDTAALVACCQMWALLQKTIRKAMKNPTDQALRTAVTSYHASFQLAASRVGLTPTERARLSAPSAPNKVAGIQEFAKKRG